MFSLGELSTGAMLYYIKFLLTLKLLEKQHEYINFVFVTICKYLQFTM